MKSFSRAQRLTEVVDIPGAQSAHPFSDGNDLGEQSDLGAQLPVILLLGRSHRKTHERQAEALVPESANRVQGVSFPESQCAALTADIRA
jgi:hypothetical protein